MSNKQPTDDSTAQELHDWIVAVFGIKNEDVVVTEVTVNQNQLGTNNNHPLVGCVKVALFTIGVITLCYGGLALLGVASALAGKP